MDSAESVDVTTSEQTVVALDGDDTYVFDRVDDTKDVRLRGDEDLPDHVKQAVLTEDFRLQDPETEWPIEMSTYGRVMDGEAIGERLYHETGVPNADIPDRFGPIPELEVTYTVDKDGSISIESVDW